MTKLRSKLKIVEELTATVKIPKIENIKKNILPFQKIKEITTFMLSTLDRLEGMMLGYFSVTDFLLKMKNSIIKPIKNLNRKYLKISTSVTQSTQPLNHNISHECKILKEAEDNFEVTRTCTLLVTVRTVRSHFFLFLFNFTLCY